MRRLLLKLRNNTRGPTALFSLEIEMLWKLLAVVMITLAFFGMLIGLLFGNPLIGAAIGAAIPPVWCIAAVCFVQALEIVFKGQWG